jgi:ATP-binding cassette subfamily F protein 3
MDGLSGGERRRLSLAILVTSGENVLILDEPTNHLDIDAREALEDALSGFEGNVLLVSHDRALLDAVGTRTIALEDGHLRSYQGGWAEYSRLREERRDAERARPGREKRATAKAKAAAADGAASPAARSAGNGRAKPSGPSKNAIRRVAQLEREVEKAESALRAIEDELGDPSAWVSPTASERAAKRHAEAKKAVQDAYARWEAASA